MCLCLPGRRTPTPPSSHPAPQLRKRLHHAFPGGPPKQSTIVHASIARLLTPSQLSKEQIAAVQVQRVGF